MSIFGVSLNFSLILIFRLSLLLNPVDVGLHSSGTFVLHPLRYMAIDIQGKGGGGVAQVVLYGLDVIAVLDGQHSVCMTKAMDRGSGNTYFLCDLFVMVAEGGLGNITAVCRSKYQSRCAFLLVLPAFPVFTIP